MVRAAQNLKSMLAASVLGAALLSACGGSGASDSAGCSLCGDMSDLTGSITSQANGQSQMAGWVVVMLETATGMTRVGEVDAAGIYSLGNVRTGNSQTIAVLSPDYILLSVLSVPGTVANSIRQFFHPTKAFLPRLIQKGPIVTFQDMQGITMTKDLAADEDADGIPNGSASIGATSTSLSLLGDDSVYGLAGSASIDLDLDGVPNDTDPDIDGDGIVNWLDPDNDGDATLDVFDGDANGNLINDTLESNGDLYFEEGVEFIAVQYEMKPKETGSGNVTTLTFTAKVRDDVTPEAVQIRGAPSLLKGALTNTLTDDGNVVSQAWNGLLGDDGISDDSSADDRIFAKKITLEGGISPRGQETLFFELAFKEGSKTWYIDYPFTFPNLKPAAITTSYDKNLRTVRLIGSPFGDVEDFTWSINLYDETGAVVWPSQAIPGGTSSFPIQDGIMTSGHTYKYSVVAQVLDKVPGFPAYTIHSAKKDIK